MEISELTVKFIEEHIKEDSAALRLKFAGKSLKGIDLPFALTQIEARRKALAKLPWLAQTPDFVFPDTLSAEQCTAAPIAGLHAEIAARTASAAVLDLTCGLGIDALSLASIARRVDTCEISERHVQAAMHNARVFGRGNLKVHGVSAQDFISALPCGTHYDLVFADPARRSHAGGRTYAFEDCSPDILSLMPALSSITPRVLIKASPMLDVSLTLKKLPSLYRLYVVSLRGECKELLCDCRFAEAGDEVRFSAVNILSGGECSQFDFSSHADRSDSPVIEDADRLSSGQWLFEPNASLMKLLSYAPMRDKWPGMKKLADNTHLYVGEGEPPADLPGRVCQIEAVSRYNKKELPPALAGKVNIVCRNFPDTPEQVKRKLRLADGGNSFLYCATVRSKDRRLILATPIANR